MKRRDFVRRFAVVIAAFLGGRQIIQKAIALTVSIDRMKIKKELEQKYGEKEAEIASQIIIKYIKAVKKGEMSKEIAARLCFNELIKCPQTPKIAKELKNVLRVIERFKNRKRELIVSRG
ncbi:MAG: hypothetical protein H0Z28_12280 [Archaeoglobus sp.]|nr:hypothetical protein [Archaeoglobus sp.]